MNFQAVVSENYPSMDQPATLDDWTVGGIEPRPAQLPTDWQLVTLAEVARLESGHTPSRRKLKYWSGGIPWVSLNDIGQLDDPEIYATRETISDEGLNNSSTRLLPAGTVIFSRTASVGKSTILGVPMCTTQDFANYICGRDLHNYYLMYLFRYMKATWKRLMAGSTHNTIYMPVFKRLQILLPPLREQESIAEALSHADSFIASLDALIAKKRDLKQAAMQQLLTGKTRLPGFDGEWQTLPFERVLSRINAKAYQVQTSEYSELGRHPIIDQGQSTIVGYSEDNSKVYKCPPGGVIVFGDHTCIIKFVSFDFIVGADGTQILVARPGHSTLFQCYDLQYRGIDPTGYNRHFKHLKERAFIAPSLPEQQAIASVLCDMDSELIALGSEREKAIAIKQGMMQELLTGRIRLV